MRLSVAAQEVEQAAPVSPPQPRRRGAGRRVLAVVIVLLACILAFLWYIGFLGGNVRTVVPGEVYRSAQLTDGLLHEVLQSDHIHTVINLRGGSMHDSWYRSEIQECGELGVRHVDVPMSAIHLPPPDSLRELLDTFDHASYPVLFHCQGGADRSGLTGTIYLNVYRHVPLEEAEARELTWRYGHFSWSRPPSACCRLRPPSPILGTESGPRLLPIADALPIPSSNLPNSRGGGTKLLACT